MNLMTITAIKLQVGSILLYLLLEIRKSELESRYSTQTYNNKNLINKLLIHFLCSWIIMLDVG